MHNNITYNYNKHIKRQNAYVIYIKETVDRQFSILPGILRFSYSLLIYFKAIECDTKIFYQLSKL